MGNFKMPKKEKIYEAYGAIADERVTLKEETAEVKSSSLDKTYIVEFKDSVYSSNDNSSYWQGSLGYPIIAVLMLQGKLSLDRKIADYFKGIKWKELNTLYKNKYDEVVGQILEDYREAYIDVESIENEVEKVYKEIEALEIDTKRSKMQPVK